MIITQCCNCGNEFVCGYESGDVGSGNFQRVDCEKCDTPNFVELTSVNGETLSEKEFYKRYPNAKFIN